jgi:hypothetical protein
MLDLVLASVEAIIIAGTFGVVIMMIGYVYDRLVTWARMRPISISQSPIMAYSLTTGDPLTIAEASQIAKIVPPQNRDEEWRSTLTRFSFVSRWGGFGWRSMCKWMGREGWKKCIRYMVKAGVLLPARGNVPPVWSNGWDHTRFRSTLWNRSIRPPYPSGDPPKIEI